MGRDSGRSGLPAPVRGAGPARVPCPARARARGATAAQGRDPTRRGAPPRPARVVAMSVARSVALFLAAAFLEIGGAWLVWQGLREHRGLLWVGGGVVALGLYGVVATFQSDANFGRILAAYGGVFVAGSLAWGVIADGYRPDRYDIAGALICLAGMAVIMYAPRGH
ncbi:membrane protein [Streptomyces pristinaespiralis]|nr:membrane protein [Streptomyces pristinaespiralis]